MTRRRPSERPSHGTPALARALLLAASAALLCGCGGTADDDDGPPRRLLVFVKSFQFAPARLTVRVGDTVRWVGVWNAHTVTSSSADGDDDDHGARFDHVLRPGKTFDVTFLSTGEVRYFCRQHPARMRAVVSVAALPR